MSHFRPSVISFLVTWNFVFLRASLFLFENDQEFIRDVPTLIQSEGYPSERHKVLTQDGYVLELHRIPHGKSPPPPPPPIEVREGAGEGTGRTKGERKRPVAFLVHCILCTSSIFVMQGPERGLAYWLADIGYDVWMMNTRGNSYSSNHLKYSTDDTKFWDFSWHEVGVHDFTSSVDYVLGATNQSDLTFFGFSMGTTIYFVAASTYPEEFNKKISKAVLIAPVAYASGQVGFFGNTQGPDFPISLRTIFRRNSTRQIPPAQWDLNHTLSRLCTYTNFFSRPLCAALLNILAGIRMKRINRKQLGYYFRFFPDSTSNKIAQHFIQIKVTGIFRPFDYGEEKNVKFYGTSSPPEYNISNIHTPIHMIHSTGDGVTNIDDIYRLENELTTSYSYIIDEPWFSHAHFCWGDDIRNLVFAKIWKILDKDS